MADNKAIAPAWEENLVNPISFFSFTTLSIIGMLLPFIDFLIVIVDMAKHYTKPIQNDADRALHAAARSGNLAELQKLVEDQLFSHIDCRDAQGNTALILAARYGHAQLVEVLLDAEAKVNAQNHKLETALIAAAIAGDAAIVHLLLIEGAQSSLKDISKHKAAFYAAQHNDPTLKDLFEASAVDAASQMAARAHNKIETAHEDVETGARGYWFTPRSPYHVGLRTDNGYAPTALPTATITIKGRRKVPPGPR